MTDLLLNVANLDFFNRALAKGGLVNSYILASEGASLEKYLIAKELNKILNCSVNHGALAGIGVREESHPGLEKGFIPACNHCQNCKWIEADLHPKTPIIISLEKGRNIKLEEIKKLQNTLSQSSDFFRIVIIDPADYQYLNTHSANALLKDIEEAHPRTLFLLFASNKKNVLSTLRSRSQCLQVFPEPSLSEAQAKAHSSNALGAVDVEKADEKSIMAVFEKYQEKDNLSPELKKIFFLEELKSFEREDFIRFCENLEGKLVHDFLKKGAVSSPSLGMVSIKSLEIARQDILAYVNPRAALGQVKLF